MLIFIVMKNNMLSKNYVFDGATSFDQTLNCEWKRNPFFMSGTNVCANGANCGSRDTTCPTTDPYRAFETIDELNDVVYLYCAGLYPDDYEYG